MNTFLVILSESVHHLTPFTKRADAEAFVTKELRRLCEMDAKDPEDRMTEEYSDAMNEFKQDGYCCLMDSAITLITLTDTQTTIVEL